MIAVYINTSNGEPNLNDVVRESAPCLAKVTQLCITSKNNNIQSTYIMMIQQITYLLYVWKVALISRGAIKCDVG